MSGPLVPAKAGTQGQTSRFQFVALDARFRGHERSVGQLETEFIA
jgi:hypothetical protein